MLDNYFKLIFKNSRFRGEVLFTFFFKELAYLCLPLFIIFPISVYFGKISILDFFASSNFSFVVVVLIAVVMSNFIELKTRIQNDINYKLFEGVKLFILLLIASSIVLTFIILNEFEAINTTIKNEIFSALNIGLLIISLFGLFMKITYELGYKHSLKNISIYKTKQQLIGLLNRQNETINELVTSQLYTIDCFVINESNEENNYNELDINSSKINNDITEIERSFEDIQKRIELIKIKFDEKKKELIENGA